MLIFKYEPSLLYFHGSDRKKVYLQQRNDKRDERAPFGYFMKTVEVSGVCWACESFLGNTICKLSFIKAGVFWNEGGMI